MRKVMCRLGYGLFLAGLIAFCLGAVMILGFLSRILLWSMYITGLGPMPMGWQEYCVLGGAAVLIVGVLVMLISLFIPRKEAVEDPAAAAVPGWYCNYCGSLNAAAQELCAACGSHRYAAAPKAPTSSAAPMAATAPKAEPGRFSARQQETPAPQAPVQQSLQGFSQATAVTPPVAEHTASRVQFGKMEKDTETEKGPRLCAACGAQIRGSGKFCTVCGAPAPLDD